MSQPINLCGQPVQQQPDQPPPPNINQAFGQNPQRAMCPHCNKSVLTNVFENEEGLFMWVSAVAGLFIGCCCIPCLSLFPKDQIHSYSECGTIIGARRKIGC